MRKRLKELEMKKINKIKELEEVGKELGRLEIKILKEELEEFEIKIPKIETENKIEALKQTEKVTIKIEQIKKSELGLKKQKIKRNNKLNYLLKILFSSSYLNLEKKLI